MKITESDIARFWAGANKTETCWLWNRSLFGSSAYGGFWLNGKTRRAHRIAWSITHNNADIPPGLFVCHHCDTPRCVRPDHLFLGTPRDNTLDAWNKGRMAEPTHMYGEDCFNAKLNPDKVREIKSLKGTISAAQLAKRYGIHDTTIRGIWRGKRWKHVA